MHSDSFCTKQGKGKPKPSNHHSIFPDFCTCQSFTFYKRPHVRIGRMNSLLSACICRVVWPSWTFERCGQCEWLECSCSFETGGVNFDESLWDRRQSTGERSRNCISTLEQLGYPKDQSVFRTMHVKLRNDLSFVRL